MAVLARRLLLGIAACLVAALPAAAQRTASDASPPAQSDQKGTDQTKPDPSVQIITNVFKLIEEKARADAKRKADAERAKQDAANQDAAKQDAAAAQTPPTETPKTVPVETRTPVVDTTRKTAVARKVPLRPLKPLLPRPDLSPGPLPSPKPDTLSPPAEPVPAPIVGTTQPPPPVVRPVSPNAPESSRWSGVLIDLILLTLVAVGAVAVRRWFFVVPLPLPGARAHADPGTVSAPLFADDPPLPQVSFLVASGSFTSHAEYPQGAS